MSQPFLIYLKSCLRVSNVDFHCHIFHLHILKLEPFQFEINNIKI